MRFHLVDCIKVYSQWEEAVGIKNITISDELVEYSDVDGCNILPESLVCESILQTCAWLIVKSSGGRKRPVILKFKLIEFINTACVGDCVELFVQIKNYSDDAANISGSARANGKELIRFEDCFISLLDTGHLESPVDTQNMVKCLFREE